jgi:hypothetical protein
MARSREYQDLALKMVDRDPGLMECILGNLAMTRLLSGIRKRPRSCAAGP